MLFGKIISCVLKIVWLVQFAHGQCSVNIRNDIPVKDPVYLTAAGQLWAPSGPALTWNAGQATLMVCSGSSNEIMRAGVGSGMSSGTLSCQSGQTFLLGGVSSLSSQLECKNTITGDIINSGTSCTGGGTILNLGFTIPGGFATYIQSCYNMQTGSVVYTRHVLPGLALPHAVIESSRPSFKSTGTAAHVNPAVSYTQASQLTRLTELLGSQEQAQRFIFTNSYMARGHMSPDADGIFRSWQFTTYFYTNVVPQWQVINAGNWLRIENAARAIATTMQEDLVIFNGAHGILTLPHVNGQQIPITLEAGGNIEVPFWYYKVIRSAATNSAIALVTLNNPFVTTIAANDIPCTDICAQTGWYHANYDNYALGKTICCSVADLRQRVPSVPSEALANNVLNWR